TGELRLTVWQNLIIPNIRSEDEPAVTAELHSLGLETQASSFRAGLVACTGSAGCKFAASNTKQDAMRIARHLEQHFELEHPINIHVTGCHHSCAQHYIGDIGLIGTKVEVDEDMVDGYDIYIGGGWGERRAIARLAAEKVTSQEASSVVGSIVAEYLQGKADGEDFATYASRLPDDEVSNLAKLDFAPRP
ncbi:MAG TPA: NirA family protein, partial [Planctomycetaceae bacterium]|nr:NirA family protein [Planctomycetaceae bacterium]